MSFVGFILDLEIDRDVDRSAPVLADSIDLVDLSPTIDSTLTKSNRLNQLTQHIICNLLTIALM